MPNCHVPAVQRLPLEILESIIALTGDWELATTLHISTQIPFNAVWWQATELDWAILSSSLLRVKAVVENNNNKSSLGLSQWGARVMIRFGYVEMLSYLYSHPKTQNQVKTVCGPFLASIASAWGRVPVLEWAKEYFYSDEITRDLITEEAIDEASRHGQIAVLDWWKSAIELHPLKYSENALSSATVKEEIPILNWWKSSNLPLKIGNVLDFASMARSTSSLEWWSKQSGLLAPKYSKAALYSLSCSGNISKLDWWLNQNRFPLLYDKEVLIAATKYGQVESLQWWKDSKLEIEYRLFDIEAALEDAVANDQETLKWWAENGYQDSAGITDWMRNRKLGL